MTTPKLEHRHFDALESALHVCAAPHYPSLKELHAILRAMEERSDDLERIYDFLGIGKDARKMSVLMVCLENQKRFAEYLSAVEHAFFMVPGEPSDEPEDEEIEPEPDCVLSSWSAESTAAYVEQFRKELPGAAARLVAPPPQAPAVPDVRAAFERWMSENGKWPKAIRRDADGHYALMQASHAWTAWEAAVAAFAAPAPQPIDSTRTDIRCKDCPPVGYYLTDIMRCDVCPRRTAHLYKYSPDHGEGV